jgi:transposase
MKFGHAIQKQVASSSFLTTRVTTMPRLFVSTLRITTVELLFLPSYSPNLNLIERLWRFLKDKVMTIYHETFEEFVDEVDKVLDNLDEYANELASLMTEKFEILACV